MSQLEKNDVCFPDERDQYRFIDGVRRQQQSHLSWQHEGRRSTCQRTVYWIKLTEEEEGEEEEEEEEEGEEEGEEEEKEEGEEEEGGGGRLE